jgi:hypothetical protein
MVHAERLADPLDEITRAIGAISKKRNKTEADHAEIGRLEFMGSLYTSPMLGLGSNGAEHEITVPAWNLLRSLQQGAQRHKRGLDVLRGVFPLAEHTQLDFDGPRDPEERWKGGYWLRKTVGVQRARTIRTRPIFNEWVARLEAEVDSSVFDLDTLGTCWRDAGVYVGLGEMRPVYGRFKGTIESVS